VINSCESLPDVIETTELDGTAVTDGVGATDGSAVWTKVPNVRLTCGNLKGGVGKTTSAAFLACGLARSGSVLLVDADPYGSLYEWAQADGFPAEVISWPVKDLARRVQAITASFDHIVIDTGPNHEAMLRQALAVTDLLLIPCSPTLMDVERLGATLDLVEEVASLQVGSPHHVEARILFTKTSATSLDLRDAREGLASQGLPLLDAHVRDLVHYSRSRGGVPTELLDYEAVLAELTAVKVA
jgi:chromosome partitioning protein